MTLRPPSSRLPLMALALLAACGEGGGSPRPAAAPPAPAGGGDAVGEAAASYRIVSAAAPAAVARGGGSTLSLEIRMTRPDVHVQAEFPLRIALTATEGLALPKRSLGHADAVDPAAKGRRWEVPVTAERPGAHRIDATLRFALCKETEPLWCVTRNETVSVPLEVR